jgi:hypothetical protein
MQLPDLSPDLATFLGFFDLVTASIVWPVTCPGVTSAEKE